MSYKIKKEICYLLLLTITFPCGGYSQNDSKNKNIALGQSLLQTNFKSMPYNRLVKSAGRVISYGDPKLENHALDLCLLPGKKFIAVEDRYGIAILDVLSNSLIARFSFSDNKVLKNLVSTYSGITSFKFHDKTFIAWGASATEGDHGGIIIAFWNGNKIQDVTLIPIQKLAPAKMALPNQIITNTEDGILYLYVVLNGNNEVKKIRFDDKQVTWTSQTGVAPYGLCIIHDKVYVTNWGGPTVKDTLRESAGTPWGLAYTDPVTGATQEGSLSVIATKNGASLNELQLGLHPNAIIKSGDDHFLYVANGNSDYISVIDVANEKVIDSIATGIFSKEYTYNGSTPEGLMIDSAMKTLYVANGMDNAIAVIKLGKKSSSRGSGKTLIQGYIPTEAYPSGILELNNLLYITNLEATGSSVLSNCDYCKTEHQKDFNGYTIHNELASISIIQKPAQQQLSTYTRQVKSSNLYNRAALALLPPRHNAAPRPLPERIGEPSLFKHVVYIIKENKTYDEVFGDIPQGRGDINLCLYGEKVTPNQHKLAKDFQLLDNYNASGKSSAEGHQWTDAGMVSDYIEKNVRAWFRSYPHRQEDALVYSPKGFLWNSALDHGKKVRIYGEACLTHYDKKMKWLEIYDHYLSEKPLSLVNTSTIARIRPIISPDYPDCNNINFTDQIRAQIFINDWKKFEQQDGDSLPDFMVLSLPDDHTSGTSENFPTPRAMVADNDLALGKIIEVITHSRFWNSTVVFVTEDDSQSGYDHISPYRTTGFIISPYSIFSKPLHTDYNQTSIVRTIENILGLPVMNVIDATALPMFDCFTDTLRPYTFTHLHNVIPLNEMNKPLSALTGKAKYYAKLSAERAFKEVDGGDDILMNKILWFDAKGNEKFPTR